MKLTRRNMLMGLLMIPALRVLPETPAPNRLPRPPEGAQLLSNARAQIGVTTSYDPAYVRLGYPGGDVPRDRGVCIDVVIRAYRDAFDFDFQKAIHEDMAASFTRYPKIWGLSRPDRNIDHRRVPNLETWLDRHGYEAPVGEGWQAGDLMTCRLPGNLPHVGIVSQWVPGEALILRVVHNIGRGTQEEPLLLTGLSGIRRFHFIPDGA